MFLKVIRTSNIFAFHIFGLNVCVHPWFHFAGEIWASRNGSAWRVHFAGNIHLHKILWILLSLTRCKIKQDSLAFRKYINPPRRTINLFVKEDGRFFFFFFFFNVPSPSYTHVIAHNTNTIYNTEYHLSRSLKWGVNQAFYAWSHVLYL